MNDETHRYHLLHRLRFLMTPAHPCSYLPERQAATLFVDPDCALDTPTYSTLAQLGFRRSGEHLYRPQCPQCRACIPVRVCVNEFVASRSQRRAGKRNADIAISWLAAEFRDEHFALYQRYMKARHPGSSMDDDDPQHYQRLLSAPWCETRLLELRREGELLGVAITDVLQDGYSAVYTYFDTQHARRTLGGFAILQQIAAARQAGLPYVYLGYWIRECDKMAYKDQFHPFEAFDGQVWRRHTQ